MNAAELRALRDDLHRPVTEVDVETTEGNQFGPRGWYPVGPPANSNQTYETYFRIDVAVEGNTLRISKAGLHPDDPYDGVFLPYAQGKCTRVDMTAAASNIVVSAWFAGCTFVKCKSRLPVPPIFGVEATPDIDNQSDVVAHNYQQGNDPAEYHQRLQNFRQVCNAVFLDVFETSSTRRAALGKPGLFGATADDGLIIGTLVNNRWQWDWLTREVVTANTGHISDWLRIPALEWRSLVV